MSESLSTSGDQSGPEQNSRTNSHFRGGPFLWATIAISALIILWFFGVVPRYGPAREQSALLWVYSAWNAETGYEHGPLVPIVMIGLIVYGFKSMRAGAREGSNWGLVPIMIGAGLFVVAFRTFQPRIAIGGLPFVLWGCSYYYWGWKTARLLLFPLFFFWLADPLPSFQQATTQLQMLATSLAHHGSGLFGVETYTKGTLVLPVKGDWKPLDIAGGCSGIRSLMALIMVSAAWAYVAKMSLWKRVFLFLMAFPLAIIGNALRVISIFVIAEYGDAKWATTTWHDWSGLLLFYPFSLMSLLIAHSLLEGGLPWRTKGKKKLRRVVVSRTGTPDSDPTEA